MIVNIFNVQRAIKMDNENTKISIFQRGNKTGY